MEDARGEHARLVTLSEVTVTAERKAVRILTEAQAEAQRMRTEVEEYVDTTLAKFEQVLQQTLATVQRGRDRMRALSEVGPRDPEEVGPGAV